MDGENKGSKPYEQMDDLGGPPLFLVQHPYQTTNHGFVNMNHKVSRRPTTSGCKKRWWHWCFTFEAQDFHRPGR